MICIHCRGSGLDRANPRTGTHPCALCGGSGRHVGHDWVMTPGLDMAPWIGAVTYLASAERRGVSPVYLGWLMGDLLAGLAAGLRNGQATLALPQGAFGADQRAEITKALNFVTAMAKELDQTIIAATPGMRLNVPALVASFNNLGVAFLRGARLAFVPENATQP